MPLKGEITAKRITYNCENCSVLTETREIYYNRRKHHFCGRRCQCLWQSKSRLREHNPYWKGDKKYNYKKITIDGKSIPLHRFKMEQTIKRKLRKGEEVHHIDFNPLNNDSSNLLLCSSKAEHRKHHRSRGISNEQKINVRTQSSSLQDSKINRRGTSKRVGKTRRTSTSECYFKEDC